MKEHGRRISCEDKKKTPEEAGKIVSGIDGHAFFTPDSIHLMRFNGASIDFPDITPTSILEELENRGEFEQGGLRATILEQQDKQIKFSYQDPRSNTESSITFPLDDYRHSSAELQIQIQNCPSKTI